MKEKFSTEWWDNYSTILINEKPYEDSAFENYEHHLILKGVPFN